MINLNSKKLRLMLLSIAIAFGITACGVASEVINHDANDMRLLKPGALDLPINQTYRNYKYIFLNKYKVSHDWIFVGNCYYGSVEDLSGQTIYTGNIYEKNENTFVDRESPDYPKDSRYKYGIKNVDITKYTRPEFVNGTDSNGNPMIVKGFQPICFQSWGGTSHVLAIKIYKKDIATWKSDLAQINPNGKFTEETIGESKWLVQTNDIGQRALNGTGGAYLHYSTAIGNTGYTLTIQLGANQDSLKHTQTHAQMQAIFNHLIESVKIEKIN